MKPETKVGIFTIIGVALFGFSLYFLGGISVTKSYDLNIKFQDVSGLPIKAAVKLAGVEVGRVKKIKIENEDVIVVTEINKDVRLREGAQFSVVMTGIIGSKYLKIVQGPTGAPLIAEGAYVNGTDEIPMDVMIAQTMGSIKEFVDSVNNNGQMGAQLNQTMTEIRQLSANLNQMVASLRPYITSSVQNLEVASAQLSDLMAKADSLLEGINKGEGVIGGLMKDDSMKDDVKQSLTDLKTTLADVKQFVGKMNRFRVDWNYDFFYMPQDKVATSDLGLDIYTPSGYTFYHVGMANLGNEDDTPKEKDYYEKNKLDARLGLYNEWAKFSAGLIRGAGGVALELTPFYKVPVLKGLTVSGEATDFGRDRVINGREFNKPNLSYGVDFRLNRFVRVGAWMRDALETNNAAVRANVTLTDEDISSFFGLAAMAGSK